MYGSKNRKKMVKVYNKKPQKNRKKLSLALENKLKEHSKHHTKKHIAEMRKLMKQGMSFNKAHAQAMKTKGK